MKFFKLPRESQIAKVKEWLLFAVMQAEKELGSGTGQLKLRYVYDMFVSKFPYLVQFVSFEFFSKLVDDVTNVAGTISATLMKHEGEVKY